MENIAVLTLMHFNGHATVYKVNGRKKRAGNIRTCGLQQTLTSYPTAWRGYGFHQACVFHQVLGVWGLCAVSKLFVGLPHFWIEVLDVVLGICWSHLPTLGATASNTPSATGNILGFPFHVCSRCSISLLYFSFSFFLVLHKSPHISILCSLFTSAQSGGLYIVVFLKLDVPEDLSFFFS